MSLDAFIAARSAELEPLLADPVQWVALIAAALAAALVITSAFVKTIIPLRWLAVTSNIGFIFYGALHPAPLVLALHAALLPINLWRVLEMRRLTQRVRQAQAEGSNATLKIWLQPFMKRKRLKPGAVLFKRGDPADRLYVLAEGRLEVAETGAPIEAGQLIGEISFFVPDGKRTGTVRCVESATLLSIDETTFRQVFFQDPSFGFEVVRTVAARLSADVARLQDQLAKRDAGN